MNEKTAVESVIGKMRSWLRHVDGQADEDRAAGGCNRALAFPADDVRALLGHIDRAGEGMRQKSEQIVRLQEGIEGEQRGTTERLGDKLTGGDLKKGDGT